MICPSCRRGGQLLAGGAKSYVVAAFHLLCAARHRAYPHFSWCDCACKSELVHQQPARSA